MGNLFLSFTIAIGGAIGVVTLGRLFDFDSYVNRILPIIPILYAIVYEVLDRRKTRRSAKVPAVASERTKVAPIDVEAGITAGKIITDVAVSFAIKFSLEIFLTILFLKYSGQAFNDVYGKFTIETVGRFLRGEHPWLAGHAGIYLLTLVAITTSLITGLWIGYTARGNAIVEGVLAGAAITLIYSMTNMLVLYQTIEETAVRLVDSMGYVMRAGFLIVLALQVLLYVLWSGIVQSAKEERASRGQQKKPARKTKK